MHLLLAALACTAEKPCTPLTFHLDRDGDGYAGEEEVSSCEEPAGWSAQLGDCDDGQASAHPGAAEVWYDGIDQDCEGGDDLDADGDGYRAAEAGGDDCDDADPGVHPDADELCGNGRDDNCVEDDAVCEHWGTGDLDGSAKIVIEGSSNLQGLSFDIDFGADLDVDGRPELMLVDRATASDGMLPRVLVLEIQAGIVSEERQIEDDDVSYEQQSRTVWGGVDLTGDSHSDALVADSDYVGDTKVNRIGPGRIRVYEAPIAASSLASSPDFELIPESPDSAGFGAVVKLSDREGEPTYALSLPLAYRGGLEGAGAVLSWTLVPEATGAQVVSSELIHSNVAYAALGRGLSASDLDGDGVLDLQVAAERIDLDGNGTLVSGIATLLGPVPLDTAIQDHDGLLWTMQDGRLGITMQSMGDLDGDGLDDLLTAGVVEVVSSPEAALVLPGSAMLGRGSVVDAASVIVSGAAQSAEDAMVAAGDVNGDGEEDVLVIGDEDAPDLTADGHAPVLSLYYGPLAGALGPTDADANWYLEDPYYRPRRVLSGTDLTGDGCDEIVLGDRTGPDGDEKGKLWVLFGGCP